MSSKITFDTDIKSKKPRTQKPSTLIALCLKIPGVETPDQAKICLLGVIGFCICVIVINFYLQMPETYDIPPQAYQEQILNE